MADFVFNVAAGRIVELANRVNNNDPTNAAFVFVVLETTGLESDAILKDYDTLAAIFAGGSSEPENSGYARVTRADGTLTVTVTDGSDKVEVDTADITWADVVAGDGWSKLLVCYDSDTTAGTDTNIIPLVGLDFTATPDGNDIIFEFNASGFHRATT